MPYQAMDSITTSNSPTRILEIAKELFWIHGTSKVTVEEICNKGGLSKMTFNWHFKNKHEVARKLVTYHLEKSRQRYYSIMKSNKDFEEKVRQLIQFKYETFREMSSEFIRDVYQMRDLGLGKMFDEYRQEIQTELRNDLARAQKDGWIKKDVKLDFIMYSLNDL